MRILAFILMIKTIKTLWIKGNVVPLRSHLKFLFNHLINV